MTARSITWTDAGERVVAPLACLSRDPSLAPSTAEPRCERERGHAGKHRRRVVRRAARHSEPDYGAAEWSGP